MYNFCELQLTLKCLVLGFKYYKMDLLKYIVLLLLCLFNSYTCLTKFKVEVLDKGNSPCERTSKYGDQVFVHFVGTKLSTGEEFDRRWVTSQLILLRHNWCCYIDLSLCLELRAVKAFFVQNLKWYVYGWA